jgi:hypothetical protein
MIPTGISQTSILNPKYIFTAREGNNKFLGHPGSSNMEISSPFILEYVVPFADS